MAKKRIFGTQTFNSVKEAYDFIQDLEVLKNDGSVKDWKTIAKWWQRTKYYVVCYEII